MTKIGETLNSTEEVEYKINVVTDEDMKEPDRNEYQLREASQPLT